MTNRYGLGATTLALAILSCAAAGAASAAPSPGSAPALQYGGFEISQTLWACSIIVNNALHDAGLNIDESLSTEGPITPGALPAKIAGDRYVDVGAICLPTNSGPDVLRVLVVAASTSSSTAEAYRNAVRADIIARAKGAVGQAFRGPATGSAPNLVVTYGSQRGTIVHHSFSLTPEQAALALQQSGLSPEGATPGGEVAGVNSAASVVVAANACPASCTFPSGVYAVFSSSTDSNTANAYRDAVQKAVLTELSKR